MSTKPTNEPAPPAVINGPVLAEAMADWIQWRMAQGECPAGAEGLATNLAALAVKILHERGAIQATH